MTHAGEWRRTDRSFAGLSLVLDDAILSAAPDDGGRAVDLGCGAGRTSMTLATARPDLDIVGVDISRDLVAIATERGRDLPNLRFAVADVAGDAHAIAAGARLLFSRHGVMFYDDPAAVFGALRGAVAPGARLVFSCFRAPSLNPWAATLVEAVVETRPVPAAGYAPGPFGFADPDWVGAMLAAAGWTAAAARPVDYTYIAGAGDDPVADAVAFFSRIGPAASAIRATPPAEREVLRHRLAAALEPWHQDGRVSFPAAAWIWSARA